VRQEEVDAEPAARDGGRRGLARIGALQQLADALRQALGAQLDGRGHPLVDLGARKAEEEVDEAESDCEVEKTWQIHERVPSGKASFTVVEPRCNDVTLLA
jgi:hypothetical protein